MAHFVKCDQCSKIEDASKIDQERGPWLETREAHEGDHGEEACQAAHKLFCGWSCLGIYSTAKGMLGKLGE